jgi:hypothetical protein
MRRVRNKNPNCNHNSSTVFYQPHYNNVKYDDNNGKKEEVLRKIFFKESSKVDDARGNSIQAAGAAIMSRPIKSCDPQTNLYVMEHALSESMYIKDIQAAVAQSRSYMNL